MMLLKAFITNKFHFCWGKEGAWTHQLKSVQTANKLDVKQTFWRSSSQVVLPICLGRQDQRGAHDESLCFAFFNRIRRSLFINQNSGITSDMTCGNTAGDKPLTSLFHFTVFANLWLETLNYRICLRDFQWPRATVKLHFKLSSLFLQISCCLFLSACLFRFFKM